MSTENILPNKFNQSDCLISPGETVTRSGIYEICHSDEPRVTVLLTVNTVFPFCRRCGELVRYKLLHSAPHISEDPDFQEDFSTPDNPAQRIVFPKYTFPLQLGISHGFRFGQETVQAGGSGTDSGDI
jgi:hypothetical protein